MTMVSVAAGWLLAGRALRPLRDITATARRVSGENLGERIALEGPADELKELADTFDGMLDRLDAAFASQRHFVANASHELRTPLAIMRTEVDVVARRPGRAPSTSCGGWGRPCARRRPLRAADRGPADARPQRGGRPAARSRRPRPRWRPTASPTCARVRSEADVEMRDDLEPAWTRGEPALLERMIANLIDNGIRHNDAPGGLLRSVTTRTEGGRVHRDRRQRRAPDRPRGRAER